MTDRLPPELRALLPYGVYRSGDFLLTPADLVAFANAVALAERELHWGNGHREIPYALTPDPVSERK